ncbi:MAG TPA: mevalonate kinase [Methanosarcinaceae archaeon]|nr:mevalonate kinase [Methanosarcinaceae archaeon]
MVTCSAPGKIYLFGEHAVVYGESAICCAVDLRTRVHGQPGESVKIESVLGKTGIDPGIHPYVSAVIECMREFTSIKGVNIKIDSDIPVGSGLGSSAAVTIATIAALNYLFDCKLTLEDIAKLGHEVEIQVQGVASPTDTYISTMGGAGMIPQRTKLKHLDCEIVIGNTGMFSSTKELVVNVANLRESYPQVIGPILSTIGSISEIGKELVNNGDYASIGKLMNINHGLLDSVGVSSIELSSLVYAARNSGAFGAKITGAGGGGCMVALVDKAKTGTVADAINAAGGSSIITNTTEHGVLVESDQ